MLRISEQFLETIVGEIQFEEEVDAVLDMLLDESSMSDAFYEKYHYFLLCDDDAGLTVDGEFLNEAVKSIYEGKDKAFAFIQKKCEMAKPRIIELLKEAVKAAITRHLTTEPIDEKDALDRIKEILVNIVDKALAIADNTAEIDRLYDDWIQSAEMYGDNDELWALQETYKEFIRDIDHFMADLEEMFGFPLTKEEGTIADVMYALEGFVGDVAEDVSDAVRYLEAAQGHLAGVIASETSNAEEDVVERLFEPHELETLVEVQEQLSSMLEKVFVD